MHNFSRRLIFRFLKTRNKLHSKEIKSKNMHLPQLFRHSLRLRLGLVKTLVLRFCARFVVGRVCKTQLFCMLDIWFREESSKLLRMGRRILPRIFFSVKVKTQAFSSELLSVTNSVSLCAFVAMKEGKGSPLLYYISLFMGVVYSLLLQIYHLILDLFIW